MAGRPFSTDDFFRLREPTFRVPMHLSPDGQLLSLTIRSRSHGKLERDQSFTPEGIPGEMVGSRVLVVDTRTGDAQTPFGPDATSWAGVWSPSGRLLAAYVQHGGPPCPAVWDRASGEVRTYPDVHVRPFFGFEVPRWTPDSSALVLKLLATGKRGEGQQGAPRAAGAPVRVYSFRPDTGQRDEPPETLPGWADGYICDLGLVDVGRNQVRVLVRDWRTKGWAVSPDGRSVAVLRYTEAVERLQQFYYDLTLIPLDGADPRVLARRIPQEYGIGMAWSPDGRFIAYTGNERAQKPRAYIVAADGVGKPVDLSDPDEDMELSGEEAPRWSADGKTVLCPARGGHWELAKDGTSRRRVRPDVGRDALRWVQRPLSAVGWTLDDGRCLYLTRHPGTKDEGLARVDARSDGSKLVFELPKRQVNYLYGMEVSHDGAVYLLLEGSEHPAELWRWAGGEPERLLSLNPHLEGVALGRSRLIAYRALDGRELRAAVLLPPTYVEGEWVPVLVEVYGGSIQSDRLHAFNGGEAILHPQLLAARGYAVLLPDMPMADRDPMRQLPGLVLPAVNQLVELGIADPERVGVMGNSYGGYCTLGLLVQTGRFRAAVANAGFYDLVSAYITMDPTGISRWLGWAESGQGRMGGSLWERRHAYIENSPLHYLDRVTTPVLLTCGSEDLVPPAQAAGVFVGLRHLGKEAELREYEGEGHWTGMWSEPAYRDLAERVPAWLDEHLGGAPDEG